MPSTLDLYSSICGALKWALRWFNDSHFSITVTTFSSVFWMGISVCKSTVAEYSIHPSSSRTFGTLVLNISMNKSRSEAFTEIDAITFIIIYPNSVRDRTLVLAMPFFKAFYFLFLKRLTIIGQVLKVETKSYELKKLIAVLS